MGVFALFSSKFVSTNCNPSLYGVFDEMESVYHRISTNRNSKPLLPITAYDNCRGGSLCPPVNFRVLSGGCGSPVSVSRFGRRFFTFR